MTMRFSSSLINNFNRHCVVFCLLLSENVYILYMNVLTVVETKSPMPPLYLFLIVLCSVVIGLLIVTAFM